MTAPPIRSRQPPLGAPRALALRRSFLGAVVAVGLMGCGAPRVVRTVAYEETRIVASRGEGGELVTTASNPTFLFDDGNRLLRGGDCAGAVANYDRLVQEFPSSRFVSSVLYSAGRCLQDEARWADARERYERLLALRPDSPDVSRARFQLAEVLEALEVWEPALANAEALLAQGDLHPGERLEALARRARATLGLGRLEEAARLAREALSFYRTRPPEQAIADDTFAAMSTFVLAEATRLQAEAIVLPPGTALEQHRVLERRAALLLRAQRAYFDTIGFGDARWATVSGYRIGAMYRSFFDAATSGPIPPPPEPLGPEAIAAYERDFRAEVRDLVLPLVRHAIHYWELTLTMVERTGVESEWIERLEADLRATRDLIVPHAASETSPAE